jgi:hypothetical protein
LASDQARALKPRQSLVLNTLLPSGAEQGQKTWYIVRFTAVLSGVHEVRGSAVLKADLAGWTTNEIEFERISSRNGCESGGVRWHTVDLLRGVRNRVACSGTLRLTSDNYVPDGSIRPGRGKLAISVSPGLGQEAHLEIAAGAGLYATARGPAEIRLVTNRCPRSTGVAGKWTRVSVGIKNRGERPATRVRLAVAPTPGVNVRLKSSRPIRIPADQSRRLQLWVKTRRTGLVHVRLLATSNSNQAAAVCRLRMSSPTQSGGFFETGPPGPFSGLGSVVLASLGIAFLGRLLWRRKQRAVTT